MSRLRGDKRQMIAIADLVTSFFEQVGAGAVEIYNEFSLQHELGFHLRSAFRETHKIQFERPVSYFGLGATRFLKREIDISIFTPDRRDRRAIELKFPRAGQHPEQMFKACQDIAFLEQLVGAGFVEGVFVMAADDHLFFTGLQEGIYAYFRGGGPLQGTIIKPTGRRDKQVSIRGPYSLAWRDAGDVARYLYVSITPKDAA